MGQTDVTMIQIQATVTLFCCKEIFVLESKSWREVVYFFALEDQSTNPIFSTSSWLLSQPTLLYLCLLHNTGDQFKIISLGRICELLRNVLRTIVSQELV